MTPEPVNRLAGETSPYLLQHARNPVAWHPWGEEALERARREDKPILLSIGYSACHWCHVMAHESFEDEATAALMNEHFINIKVDREERPDLDRIYQMAHQILVRRPGGWPLTMMLTPDQVPFIGGTYFPPVPRHGLPAFRDVLARVADLYRKHRDSIREQNDSLVRALAAADSSVQGGNPDKGPLRKARAELAESYDDRHGGFGIAPKFPRAANIEFLLRLSAEGRGDNEAEFMALHSLRAMATGGLFDQLGGGFFRYAVDQAWLIPHFEKMLYDNGALLGLYTDAYLLTGDSFFRGVAERTGDWIMREMQSPDGGYYASLDADSEGGEGGYYVWDREQMRSVLDEQHYEAAAACYGLDEPANFEGRWHLLRRRALSEIAAQLGLSRESLQTRLREARKALFAARSHRCAPGRDEKILTSWNALAIKAMAAAGHRLQRPEFIRSAQQALDFIRARMFRDGRLIASYKDGKGHLPGYLDDYAFLIEAVLALLEARWQDGELNFAISLADTLLEHFEDEARGGFFFTADDHEKLIQRPKPFADESMASGNGVAARALNRLGHLTGTPEYLDAAQRTIEAAWEGLSAYPSAHGAMLIALDEILSPPQTIVLRGKRRPLGRWLAKTGAGYAPDRMVLAIPPDAADLPDGLAQKKAEATPVAYVCSGQKCSPPIRDPEAL